MNKRAVLVGGFLASVLALVPILTFAATTKTGELKQVIDAGVLSTDIVDASSDPVASPSFSMTAVAVSTACQTATGTYGSNTQRVAVDNPGGADDGWTLTIAATDGSSAKWTAGSNTYDFDDPAGSGCTNGQLSLDPSVASLTANAGSATGITKGPSASFNANSSITLMTASAASDDIWNGYLTDIGVSQKIPANTPAGTYVIDLTQTVTAS